MSEKSNIFSDMQRAHHESSSAPASLVQTIARKIKADPGGVFSPVDFVGPGNRAAVDQALSRMTSKGELVRIGRGFYSKPRSHPLLGDLVPDAYAIARALAGKGKLRLQPSGAYAANLLGLSEQVPMKLSFLTDGVSRTVRLAGQEITLKHTTPRNMAATGRISGLVIQALRYWKQNNVNPELLGKLKRHLKPRDRAILLTDAPLAPAWIGRIMRQIATERD